MTVGSDIFRKGDVGRGKQVEQESRNGTEIKLIEMK
jgi:hypothetical protein